jgi:hypothetical protein
MVTHDVLVRGVDVSGAVQPRPVLLQMNAEDFPGGFLRDLGALGKPPQSSVQSLSTGPATPVTLYSPVQRVVHLAMLQLACDTVQFPRLNPTRVLSAGLVVRRVVRRKGNPVLSEPPSAWMRSADGQFQWVRLQTGQEEDDPNPALRPQLQSGQPGLDELLSLQSLTSAGTEVATPAFVAAPEVCNAAGRTLLYAVIPTASSEVATQAPARPQYDRPAVESMLSPLLKSGVGVAPLQNLDVSYRAMSDQYAKTTYPTAAYWLQWQSFSATLRLLHTVAGVFENTPEARRLLAALNTHKVTFLNGSQLPMGSFFQNAAAALIDFDPSLGAPAPLTMPDAWDKLTPADQNAIVDAIAAALRARSSKVLTPQGRFQDPSRLYCLRVFLRIKSENPDCPPQLLWSPFSDPFRIAAWYESSGRPVPPVPLPDPTDRNFMKNAKPNASFAVPASLMNATQGASLVDLALGRASSGAGGSLNLNWICGFSIPLITICAFFVLNIFLTLLNIVFFWLPFIKICIPFPNPGQALGDD